MKRIITLTMLSIGLLTSVNTYAQVNMIGFGIKGGLNFSTLTEDSKTRMHYQAGLSMEYEVSDNFYILSGIDLSMKGSKRKTPSQLISESGEVYEGKITTNPMYIQIPLHVACKISIADPVRLVFNTGPYIAYGLGGKSKLSYHKDGMKHTLETDYFGKHKASRFDGGLGIGIGVEIDELWVFNMGYEHGLFNVQQLDGLDTKNQNISLTIGYKFY